MYETLRIVEDIKPKYVGWENVKNLLSKKHIHNFNAYIQAMDELGYNSYYKVLNSKDYGIPQNRERVFTISIRKDIDNGYVFPEPIPLELSLKDMLEDNVDEKYFLNSPKAKKLITELLESGKLDDVENGGGQAPALLKEKGTEFIKFTDVSCTLLARDYKGFPNQQANGVIEAAGIICKEKE